MNWLSCPRASHDVANARKRAGLQRPDNSGPRGRRISDTGRVTRGLQSQPAPLGFDIRNMRCPILWLTWPDGRLHRVSDNESPDESSTRSAATLKRAVRVLQFLLEAKQEAFVSERGLDLLLNEFSGRLERELLRGAGDELLDLWEKRLPVVRAHLLREISQRPLRFSDGSQAPVVSLDLARQLIGLCPDAIEGQSA